MLHQNKPLDIEDLNISNSLSESQSSRLANKRLKSSKKVSKTSTQQLAGTDVEIQNTPKCLSSALAGKGDTGKQSGNASKRSSYKKTAKQSADKTQNTDRERIITQKQNRKNQPQTISESDFQRETQTDTFRTLNEFNVQSLIENSNRHLNIDKLNEQEISDEIIKAEREFMEIKREYQNLLENTQMQEDNEVENQKKMRLDELSSEMAQRSSFMAQLKKKQRDLVSQSFSKPAN